MLNFVMETIQSFLEVGGPVVAILMALSVFAMALIGLKLFQFFQQRVGSHSIARQAVKLWHHGNKSEALAMVGVRPGALNACLAVAMRNMAQGAKSQRGIEEDVARAAITDLHELQRGFRAMDTIAQISPLLGLFGTVLGMIEAFQNLQAAGNSVDPSLLAGGIWVALLTTAVGLAVAMPVSLTLTWFETRLEDERVAIEVLSGSIISGELPTSNKASSETVTQIGGEYAH